MSFTVLKVRFRKAEMVHVKRKIQNFTMHMGIFKLIYKYGNIYYNILCFY